MQLIIYLPLAEKKIVLTNISGKASLHEENIHHSSNHISISKENNRAAAIISPYPFNKEVVVSELFRSKSIYSFYMNYHYDSKYPFSLIAYEDNTLFELIWNGQIHALKNLLTTKAHCWKIEDGKVAATDLSNNLLESVANLNNYDVESISKIHEEVNKEEVVKNNLYGPVCFTSVIKDITGMRMVYEDKANRILNELAI
jgi:hypothetical protein